jgi:pilus assembly protein CpaF
MSLVPNVVIQEKSLQVAVRNIARVLGDDISEEQPLLDARLPDGSRVAAVLFPISVNGTTLAIRKFQARTYTLEELVRTGTLTAALAQQLAEAVRAHENIVISGRTGAGKTTLLNALTAAIHEEERIVVIEDTAELQIERANLVRLQARREQPSLPGVAVRDLVRATLRLRPDRILVGEVRGQEALDLVHALNTGHRGTLATLHANSAGESLERLITCALMAKTTLPHAAMCRQIGHGVQLLVHLDVRDGQRQVMEVLRVKGYDAGQDRYDLETVYAA